MLMKKYLLTTPTVTILALLILGGCASQFKKTQAPVPLEKEIKSIEGSGYTGAYQQTTSTGKTYHTIKKGETLWRISKDYGVSVQSILNANSKVNSKDLEIGQKLIIPASGKSSVSSASGSSYSAKGTTAAGKSSGGFIWPVKGHVTSRFGEKKNGNKNMGVYILPQPGQKIVSSKKGVVEAVSHTDNGFYVIVIKHDSGIRTMYGCFCKPVVGEGSYVEQGQPIATINQGAGASQEINFKVYVKDKPSNPMSYLP